LLVIPEHFGSVQDLVNKGSLAMVNVCNDGYIPDIHSLLNLFGCTCQKERKSTPIQRELQEEEKKLIVLII